MSSFRSVSFWKTLLFMAWSFFFYILWSSGRYQLFLRPELEFLLVLGLLSSVAFLMAIRKEASKKKLDLQLGMKLVVLILPLAHLLNAGNASLNVQDFEKRSLSITVLANVDSSKILEMPEMVPEEPEPKGEQVQKVVEGNRTVANPGSGFSSPQTRQTIAVESAESEGADQTTGTAPSPKQEPPPKPPREPMSTELTDLLRQPINYQGKTIRVVGRYHPGDPQVDRFVGQHVVTLFRFMISCCAADAVPTSVLVEEISPSEIPIGSWVEAVGTFSIRKTELGHVPMINGATLQVTQQPKRPYLY